MPRKELRGLSRWKGGYDRGIQTIELNIWKHFEQLVREEMLDYRHFVWRGQALDQWLLEPTLDRLLKGVGALEDQSVRQEHLARFKYATRGRRGSNPPRLETDDDWWALGQHHGLATPLLDWTTSPFVAAFFAFLPEPSGNGRARRRAIFGISKSWVRTRSGQIAKAWKAAKEQGKPPVVEFFEPLSDENPRLVGQGGLFTRAPDGVDLETWVKANYDGERKVRMVKITLPEGQRTICLRSLNRMNINHLSLFPDLYGASRFVNLDLIIDKY